MKKKRRYEKRKKKKPTIAKQKRKTLRSGSKGIKNILLEKNPHCDICGTDKSLQLHHIYLIRHGFKSEIEHCVLLCANCHANFHHKFDKLLDDTYRENHDADFKTLYEELKNQ